MEAARKQVELEERKRSVALFQKQKRERDELEQQIQAQKSAIVQNVDRSPTPSIRRKSSNKRSEKNAFDQGQRCLVRMTTMIKRRSREW